MRRFVVVFTMVVLATAMVSPVAARDGRPAGMTATPLTGGEVIHAAKSLSGRIAQSDPELLGRTDNRVIGVMAKFDLDAVATYRGGVRGLAATSPSKTGKALRNNRTAVVAYERYLQREAGSIVGAINNRLPRADIGTIYTTAYGGASLRLPANQAKNLLKVPGVVAVQYDNLEQMQTDATPEFIGATAAWSGLGGSTKAGQGVKVGILDSGIWPEHPSFIDHGLTHPGGSYDCQFGNGSDPDLGPAFTCNNKLIGAYAFVDTYMTLLGAEDGEYCNDSTGECSARDSDGHGTHTATTSAGAPVASAKLFGVERGPISGIAPGAHVIGYRVCLDLGCYQSDSIAAVQQAISDGVDVINFSISGGNNPYSDAVELAFLDAYAAGILVNASAGNSGPGAGTVAHGGPWTNTVGASTSNRHFLSTLKLTADGGATLDIPGVTITAGVPAPTEVVHASAAPYSNAICTTPAPEGTFTGKVVVCDRGVNARVEKGYNVMLGDAAGMILTNVSLAGSGLNSDSHWLPAIHTEYTSYAALIAFLGNAGVKAQWDPAGAVSVRGDVMASFSSRGPSTDFLKPDVTAPGVQILAGHTPTPLTYLGGPPGELYQAIAGTSMSSPHSAGVSALVKAAHPGWTPGQIKSALMTSSIQSVLKEDGTTPANPFDMGAGSIRANRAISPTVTFDVDAADYYMSAADPMNRVHLNLPSIYATEVPGALTTWRTVRNVSGKGQNLKASATAPAGASITVSPSNINMGNGASATFSVTINAANLADGRYFGRVTLTPKSGVPVTIPVAFVKTAAAVTLRHECADAEINRGSSTPCEVEVVNTAPVPADVNLTVSGPTNGKLQVQNPSSPAVPQGNGFRWSGTLSPALAPTIDGLEPGGDGYFSLGSIGIQAQPGIGDETIANFNVAPFRYGHEVYDRIGIVSNGYAVVGGGDAGDVTFVPQDMPSPLGPNNVLAPYWTDLNPGAGGAIRAGAFGCGPGVPSPCAYAFEWDGVPIYGTSTLRTFQIWIYTDAFLSAIGWEGDYITFDYRADRIGAGSEDGLLVGAENRDGSSAATLGMDTVPDPDGYFLLTSPPAPGGSMTFTYDAFGRNTGTFNVDARMTTNVSSGTSIQSVTVKVK